MSNRKATAPRDVTMWERSMDMMNEQYQVLAQENASLRVLMAALLDAKDDPTLEVDDLDTLDEWNDVRTFLKR